MGDEKFSIFKNCKHVSDYECPFCEETEEIIYDEFHGQIVCLSCGLVLFEVNDLNKNLL